MKYSKEHVKKIHKMAVEETSGIGLLVAQAPETVKHLIHDLCDTIIQLYEELEKKK